MGLLLLLFYFFPCKPLTQKSRPEAQALAQVGLGLALPDHWFPLHSHEDWTVLHLSHLIPLGLFPGGTFAFWGEQKYNLRFFPLSPSTLTIIYVLFTQVLSDLSLSRCISHSCKDNEC